MAIVRKRNEILKVKDELVNRYLDLGYDIVDENGTVLQKAVPTDTIQLKGAFSKLSAENEALKKEIADLKAQLAEAKTEKPKRTRRSSEE